LAKKQKNIKEKPERRVSAQLKSKIDDNGVKHNQRYQEIND
jgi:hypothetical protein